MSRGRLPIGGVLLVLGTVASACSRCPQIEGGGPAPGPVPPALRERLRRGVNMGWAPSGVRTPRRGDEAGGGFTSHDLRLVRSYGFTHVRLNVDPELLLDPVRPCRLRPDAADELELTIDGIVRAGLALIVDVHPRAGRANLSTERDLERMAQFWRALAGRLSRWSPNLVSFELLNEPSLDDNARWTMAAQRLVAAVRERTREHTVIVAGDRYSGVGDLVALDPLPDRNVVYAYHFYEPREFTHQGAEWEAHPVDGLRGVPYPASPERVRAAVPLNPDPASIRALDGYAAGGWNSSRIRARVETAADWARTHGVLVLCTEFGVFRPNASNRDRLAWLHDTRRAMDDSGTGWTVWDYSGGFGLVAKDGPEESVDREMLQALGLPARPPIP